MGRLRAQPNLLVGIGTGRCGTHSLAELLAQQPATTALHQPEPCLPWHVDHGWYHHVRELIDDTSADVVALVAWYYLNYVELFLRDYDARVICLQRDRATTIASIDRLTPEFDHWSNRPARANPTTEYRHLFPSYDVNDKQEALGRYYDEYYRRAAEFHHVHPDRFRMMATEELNDESSVVALLRFAGYRPGEMVATAGIRAGIQPPYRWRGGRS